MISLIDHRWEKRSFEESLCVHVALHYDMERCVTNKVRSAMSIRSVLTVNQYNHLSWTLSLHRMHMHGLLVSVLQKGCVDHGTEVWTTSLLGGKACKKMMDVQNQRKAWKKLRDVQNENLPSRNRTNDRQMHVVTQFVSLQSVALPTELSGEPFPIGIVLPSMGIEPTTLGLLDPRSNQLSYEGVQQSCQLKH
jgi:hypothetical protein